MTGGCEGAASGAGIRFSKAGTCGAGDPRRVVGSRTRPPWFANPPACPRPPRAKPGVDPTTQAAATNTAAKTRFMIVFLILRRPSTCAAPRRPSCNHPGATTFDLPCFALTPLALIRTSNRATDELGSGHRGEQNRCMARLIVRRNGGRPAGSKPAAKRMPDLEPRAETLARPEIVSSRCSRTRNSTATRGLRLQSR